MIKKTTTTPDLYLLDKSERLSEHVEATHGNGDSNHKKAQARAVEAAKVDNYALVKGNQAWLMSIIPERKKRTF